MLTTIKQRLPYIVLLAGLLIASSFGLIIRLILRPPQQAIQALGVMLLSTGLIALPAAYLAQRNGLLSRLGSIRLSLLVSYVLAVGIILINVWFTTTKLMLLDRHYLTLSGVVLASSAVIAMGFGYMLSVTISSSIREIMHGANKLAEGNLSTRVPVRGNDELAACARAFNDMATQLADMAQQERAADKARRDLVTWVSHDLRTPLTSLQVMIEALTDGVVSDPETVSRYLATSLNEVHNLRGMIDDLFQLVQFDSGHLRIKREMCSLHDLISDTLESMHVQAERKQLTLTGQVDPAIDPVWMDPAKVQRVLTNLISNAVRYTPPGGTISLSAHKRNGDVQVSVHDSGSGIAAKDLPHVFEMFRRGEAARTRDIHTTASYADRGVGLGLAIAKAFVEAHDGHIEVESEEGAGAVFHFTLPRLPSENRHIDNEALAS